MGKYLVESLGDHISKEDSVALQGLKGSYLAYLIAGMVRAGKGPFLVLTPSSSEAETLLGDIGFYLGKSRRLLHFPPWEILPYENMSPHPDIEGDRVAALYAMLTSSFDFIVAPVSAVMQRLLPKKVLGEMVDYLASGEEVPFERFVVGLAERGYVRTAQVEEMGEFSVRGGIVDIFGPSMASPVRIEFFGDEVESIRSFDLESQRSVGEEMDDFIVLPANTLSLSPEKSRRVVSRIRTRGRNVGLEKTRLDELIKGLGEGIPFQGIEFFLPDIYDEPSTFFDYLPGNITLIKVDPEELKIQSIEFEQIVKEGHERAVSHRWPFPPPDELYLTWEDAGKALKKIPSFAAGGVSIDAGRILKCHLKDNTDIRTSITAVTKDKSPLASLADRIKEWRSDGVKVFFSAHTLGQGERLIELMEPHGLDVRIGSDGPPAMDDDGRDLMLWLGELSSGFRDIDGRIIIVTEEEIFGERHKRRGRLTKVSDLQMSTFSQLKSKDYVVHIDHGIGIYRGLKKIEAGGTVGDYLQLEYSGGDKVFVPVDRLNLVQRYAGGDSDSVRVDKLGSGAWEKVKKKVKKAVGDLAKELMDIHAAREVMKGFAFSKGGEDFREFEATFEYEETPDQRAAIDDVIVNMEDMRPMDRLVCGDVGYGKTEVAVRAAFKAVMDGKQVALLVPTTILAQQHEQTFSDRFKGYPIVVEKLTRFCSAARQKEVLGRLTEGKVDVVIGTHRLIQKDVAFRSLGLIVIDEEQRFGVAHKEKLKKMKKTVDVLTLTATPIPRTLNMAMMGIKDLSIISSPPKGRQAIRTYVTKFDEETVRDAVMRELRRGGQVFFVHNRVKDIENVAARVKAIVPEAEVAVGHGQMRERELEQVMLDFYEGKSNLLVCTTIIESGLDIPSANTIFINNAQNMGLGQLYQLRGRVGRSHHRAYAYLLLPGEALLTKEARKRLQAIQEMTELSSGFHLASYDMEIRGAGNIVGSEQSGNIEAVGFELFTGMLEKAVMELKEGELMEEIEPEVKFPCPAFIPEDYVTDTNQRLNLYKRFSSLSGEDGLADMRPELLDRFGPIPPEVKNFMELISLKILLKKGMVEEAAISERAIAFTFHERAKIDSDKLIKLISERPEKYSITPDRRLKIIPASGGMSGVLEEGKNVLKGLVECDNF